MFPNRSVRIEEKSAFLLNFTFLDSFAFIGQWRSKEGGRKSRGYMQQRVEGWTQTQEACGRLLTQWAKLVLNLQSF